MINSQIDLYGISQRFDKNKYSIQTDNVSLDFLGICLIRDDCSFEKKKLCLTESLPVPAYHTGQALVTALCFNRPDKTPAVHSPGKTQAEC